MSKIVRAALVAMSASSCLPAGPKPFPPPDPELVARNRAAGDPYEGRFPMDAAMAGLATEGRLRAVLVTDEGDIDCVLEPDHAPLTVANFVGLARGLRPFRLPDGRWVRQPYYDGLAFHRAQERQFVQTGRREGRENAGFLLQDEISPGDVLDRAGTLAMANTGAPHTASGQFFLTTGDASHLEGKHTIFGTCDDEAVARRIEQRVVRGDAPILRTIRIERR